MDTPPIEINETTQQKPRSHKQLLISLAVLFFIVIVTAIFIIYGRGYVIDLSKGRPEITGTGLLAAKSTPDGAQVIINDHLTTATNNTINLAPGKYKVEIYKEGYFPWMKNIIIQKEVVTTVDAFLLPAYPALQSMTTTGVDNPVLDPSGQKLAFTVGSQSAQLKNGIYVINMGSSPLLALQSGAMQIAADTNTTFFSTAKISWSPDGQNIVATVSGSLGNLTTYLLNGNGFNGSPQDITETVSNYQQTWQNDAITKQISQIATLKPILKQVVQQNFSIVSWSPDTTKILYIASQSATIPQIITPALIGTDSTPEQRSIEQGKVYVYDIKEDKNFKILDNNNGSQFMVQNSEFPLKWLSDSNHLLYNHDKKIDVMEYDRGNETTVYAGPFLDNYVFPWPTGGKFVILTNLGNQDIPPNLYTVSLK